MQVDVQNPHVVQQHLVCAAHELPVDVTPGGRDEQLFGPRLQVGSPWVWGALGLGEP